jgi:septal ring factor EnvC (AmiA/AmiB activator)
MNSVQESKNELEAAIRYAENAISSAQGTIESMEFRQEMAKKNYQEQTGREQALEREIAELNKQVEFYSNKYNVLCKKNDDIEDELFKLRKEKEASSGPCGCQAYRNLEEKVGDLESEVNALEQPEQPTMPVIPRDVAIAIFREGVQSGVNDAVAELEGQTINICENEYCGDFEVTFARDIHLDDELDLDWMRGKVGQYNEEFVVDALKGLCADKEFECRIHGIDDQETNK